MNYFAIPGLKRSLMPPRKAKAEYIISLICQQKGIDKRLLYKTKERKEKSDIVAARRMIWLLMRQETPKHEMSLRQIGGYFGYDHSSVCHAIEKIKNDKDLKRINKTYFL